jgi:hypothetical protein
VFVHENDLCRSTTVAGTIRLIRRMCCVICRAWLLHEGHAITVLDRTALYKHNAQLHSMS